MTVSVIRNLVALSGQKKKIPPILKILIQLSE